MSEITSPGYRALLAQRDELENKIEACRSVGRNDAIIWIFEQMALFEIKPGDLKPRRGCRVNKPSGPVAPKYRDPGSDTTWSVRGRAPLLMAGQDREKFAITQ